MLRFYGEEDHPLSAVRDCLFSIFVATLHIGRRSSIRKLRTRYAVVTGGPLTAGAYFKPMFLNLLAADCGRTANYYNNQRRPLF
jgi:hypothetical protein